MRSSLAPGLKGVMIGSWKLCPVTLIVMLFMRPLAESTHGCRPVAVTTQRRRRGERASYLLVIGLAKTQRFEVEQHSRLVPLRLRILNPRRTSCAKR
jgi:hypothetical protein